MRIEFLNTRFIYGPVIQNGGQAIRFNSNFAGDPSRDKFKSNQRHGNVVIPDDNLARDMEAHGCPVKWTRLPKDTSRMSPDQVEQFVPRPYVKVNLKYGNDQSRWPRVYLARNGMPALLLDPDSVGDIDSVKIDFINVAVRTFEYEPGRISLWIDDMLVVPKTREDPIWLAAYMNPQGMQMGIPMDTNDELPFEM